MVIDTGLETVDMLSPSSRFDLGEHWAMIEGLPDFIKIVDAAAGMGANSVGEDGVDPRRTFSFHASRDTGAEKGARQLLLIYPIGRKVRKDVAPNASADCIRRCRVIIEVCGDIVWCVWKLVHSYGRGRDESFVLCLGIAVSLVVPVLGGAWVSI